MLTSLPHSRISSKGPASTRRLRRGGFTLIELLVVISIMFTLAGLLLVRQSRFDSSTLLRSLAYSVALSVRQAQVYGSSVVGTTTTAACTGGYTSVSGSNTTCFASGYGVYFAAGAPAQNYQSSAYILFADTNGDGVYSPGEDVKVFTLGKGYAVSNVCVKQISNGATSCFTDPTIGKLSIVFRRPNPDACFSTDLQATPCSAGGSAFYSSASIQIQNTGDPTNTRNVCVYKTGQIVVEPPQTACP